MSNIDITLKLSIESYNDITETIAAAKSALGLAHFSLSDPATERQCDQAEADLARILNYFS